MRNKRSREMSTAILSIVILLVSSSLAFSQQYPTKPINVMLGYSPGGTLDTTFRPLAKAAEKYLGQSLVITNNGAGGGTVGLGLAVKESPDGYHLDVCHSGLLTMTPHMRALPYKHDDLVPVMAYGMPQSALAVKADSPWKTVKDVVEFAKKNPGKFTYFYGTVGAPTHLAVEYIAKTEGVKVTPVPFAGGGPALAAFLGGHISGFSGSAFMPQARDGSVRILAFYLANRAKEFPNVPTLKELGYNFVNDEIFLVGVPKGTPSAIVKRLEEAFKKAMEDQAFLQTAAKMDILPNYQSGDEVAKYLTSAYARYGKMIDDLNIPKEEEKK
jgi:tripartite-type tricarboxylate transporter receptor subunit TctC